MESQESGSKLRAAGATAPLKICYTTLCQTSRINKSCLSLQAEQLDREIGVVRTAEETGEDVVSA